MPDIDFQRIELNLIPKKGDEPVIFYASQYETTRPFIADLKWGTTEFAPGDDCWAEIDIRKNDNNLVVITDDVAIDNNEVSVILPVQALTCIGKNLGQVKIYAADAQLIAALNFILEVQPDPLAGGVDSETAIDNLESQIAAIVPEVIGEDYYDKTEVDNLLADKADVSDLPDMTNYYTKTQTDTLLNGKADASTTYTKTEVDNALALKANSSDLATVATTGDYDDLLNKPTIPAAQIQADYAQADNTQVDYIKNKPDIAGMIAAAIFEILPVGTASGNPCSFDTEIAAALQGLTAEITASGGGGTPSTPIPIVGISSLDIVRCGINLWDEVVELGGFDADGSANARTDVIRSKNYIPCNESTNYYIKQGALTDSAWSYFVFYDSSKTVIGSRTTVYGSISTPVGAHYMRFQLNSSYGTTYGDNVSINYPSTNTSYHAYNGQTFTIDLGGTRYGCYVDAVIGKLVVTHVRVDMGDLTYWDNSVIEGGHQFATDITDKALGTLNILSSMFEALYPSNVIGKMSGRTNSTTVSFNSAETTVAAFKTSVAGQDLVYELATPIEIDVSAISVNAIVGTNNIISNGNGDVTAQYKDSIQHYIDNQ